MPRTAPKHPILTFSALPLLLLVACGDAGTLPPVTEETPEPRSVARVIVAAHQDMNFPTEADRTAYINERLGLPPGTFTAGVVKSAPLPPGEEAELIAAMETGDRKRFRQFVVRLQTQGYGPDPTCSLDLTIPRRDEEGNFTEEYLEEEAQFDECWDTHYTRKLCDTDYEYEGAGNTRVAVAAHLHCEIPA